MKKLSKILESIWSDMQDRGTGESIKKEEDFTKDEKDYLVSLYLMGYIKSCVYTYKNPYDFSLKKFELHFDDEWEYNHRSSYLLDGEDKETKKEKDWSYFTRNWDKGDDLQKKVEDEINEYEERISRIGLKRKPSYNLIDTLNYWWRSLDDNQKKLCFSRASEFVYTLNQDELDELDEWDKQKLDLKWASLSYNTKLYAYDCYTNWSDKIDESIWSDMQDRGTEDSIKKEDDTFAHFADELKKKYNFKHPEEIETDYDYMIIPMFRYTTYYSNLEMKKTAGGKKFIAFSYRNLANATGMTKKEQRGYDSLLKALDERFDTKTELTAQDRWFDKYIRPNDGREIDNNFFIEVLDFIIDTLDRLQIEYYQRFVYKLVKESIWSEMQDRGTGDIVKKEDDIEDLDRDGLLELIVDKYELKPNYKSVLVIPSQTSPGNKYISLPVFAATGTVYRMSIVFKDKTIKSISIQLHNTVCRQWCSSLFDKFLIAETATGNGIYIYSKEETITNRLCMDVIETIVNDSERSALQKREN